MVRLDNVRAIDNPMPMPSALLVKNGFEDLFFNLSSECPVRDPTRIARKRFNARSPNVMMRFARSVPSSRDPVPTRFQNDLLSWMRSPRIGSAARFDPTNQFDLSPNSKRRKKFDSLSDDVIEIEVFPVQKGAFFNRLRILRMTSPARRSSCKISFTISLSSAMSGFDDCRIASAVSAFGQNGAERLVYS